MTRAEAQRRDYRMERYYCFMVRQKGEETKIWDLAMECTLAWGPGKQKSLRFREPRPQKKGER